MKYWKLPKELQEKWDELHKSEQEIVEKAINYIKDFFQKHYQLELEIHGVSDFGNASFTINISSNHTEGSLKEKIGKEFKVKTDKNWRLWINPKARPKLAKEFIKGYTALNVPKLGRWAYADLLESDFISLSFRTNKIDGEMVFLEIDGVDKEKLGLIECEI